MPDIERYTPSQLADEVQNLAESYRGAVAEVETDNSIFDDISTAIQGKTGQAEPYAKEDMAYAIEHMSVGLPIDPDSLTPLEFGVDDEGFYWSDTQGEGTPVFIGRESTRLYAIGGD